MSIALRRNTPDAEMSPFSLLGTFANAGLPRLRLGGGTLELKKRQKSNTNFSTGVIGDNFFAMKF